MSDEKSELWGSLRVTSPPEGQASARTVFLKGCRMDGHQAGWRTVSRPELVGGGGGRGLGPKNLCKKMAQPDFRFFQ